MPQKKIAIILIGHGVATSSKIDAPVARNIIVSIFPDRP
jgi:hypothetical protein